MSRNADILLEHLKPVGAYQKRLLCVILMLAVGNAWAPLSTIFTLYVPQHRCIFDGFGNASLSTASPISEDIARENRSECFALPVIENESAAEPEKCTEWSFDTENDVGETVVSEMQLVCHNSWIPPFILSLMMAARAIGLVICGALADRFGRRPVFLVSTAVLFMSTVGMAFSPNIIVYGVFNTICGVTSIIQYSAICIFGMEMVVPSMRNFVVLTLQTGYVVGYATLPLMAYLSHDWRIMLYCISVCSTVFVVGYWYFPETIYWLLSKGRTDQIQVLTRDIATFNNLTITTFDNLLSEWVGTEEKCKETRTSASVTVFVLFKNSTMRLRLFVSTFIWLVTSFAYYAITLNTTFLPGDAYINCLVSAILEIPSILCAYWLLGKIGRVKTSLLFFVISGVTLASVALVQNVLPIGESVVVIVGKTAISGAFYVIYVHTAEVSPTMTRNLFINICSAFSNVGSIISPYIMYLGRKSGTEHVVFVAMGVTSATAGILTLLFLPETTDRSLPDTMQQALDQRVIIRLPFTKKMSSEAQSERI